MMKILVMMMMFKVDVKKWRKLGVKMYKKYSKNLDVKEGVKWLKKVVKKILKR
jgi:hypothetical protein